MSEPETAAKPTPPAPAGRMKDRDHPFFRPLWRRIALVAFCAIWSAIEYYNGQEFWGMAALGMTAYAAYSYLWLYREPPAPPAGEEPRE